MLLRRQIHRTLFYTVCIQCGAAPVTAETGPVPLATGGLLLFGKV